MGHMPPGQPEPAAPAPADAADAAEILRAITRISYLLTRARRHDRVRTVAAVPLDRAAVMVLGQIAETGPIRPGELAARLGVEAPHVTRQVRRLQQAGETGIQAALAHWPPQELHQLATLLHRMVDDFLAYTAAEEPAQPAR